MVCPQCNDGILGHDADGVSCPSCGWEVSM